MQPKILKSMRWRLLLWQAALLLGVVGSFGSLFYYRTQQAKLAEVDADLQGALLYLDVTLRSFPKHELEDGEPPFPEFAPPDKGFWPEKVPPEKGPFEKKKKWPPKGPPPVDREVLLQKLNLSDRFFRREHAYFIIWRGRGDVLKASAGAPATKMPYLPDAKTSSPQATVIWQTGDQREAAAHGPAQTLILVGTSIDRELSELDRLAWQLVLAGGGLLALGLAGSFLISRSMVRPITAMTAAAAKISASNLSHRIDIADIDSELGNLAAILNEMFTRLEGSFTQQARFTADASHELRTPLSVIHSQAELALARPRPAEEYREALETCLRATQRMKGVVEGLMLLARTDAGKLKLRPQRVDLALLAEETIDLLRPLAEQYGIELQASLQGVILSGDPDQLNRVLMNLATNAIQYNRPNGKIMVTVRREGPLAVLTVADTGQGIAKEHQPNIFQRFFRVDKSRSREGQAPQLGGSGLGLAICKSLVEAHRGSISFTSVPNEGTTFVVKLPVLDEHFTKMNIPVSRG